MLYSKEMKSLIKKVVPQKAINIARHLPTALAANLRYGFPSRKLKVIAVTGTDGKTTTVNMIYHILKSAGKNVSMISTVGARIGDKLYPVGFHVTSPSPFSVQRFFAEALKQGSEYMVLEITSHALDQYRALGVKFDIGVITNITHEHLDYHKTYENYLNTKCKLIKNARLAILNKDDASFTEASKKTSGKVVSFGLKKTADFNPLKFPLKINLPGDYNLLNALAASAVAINLGIKSEIVKEALKNFKGVKGRMEEIENNLGIKIIIDFAHTPNGLEQALKALKNEKGKVISLIGAEGYRDEGKRAMMGEISAKLADITIVTAVDPRGLIDQINKQILTGAEKAGGIVGQNVFVNNDRTEAIRMGIKMAKKGGIVAIFGKGHEASMNLLGKGETPWSDKKAVEEVLNKL